MVKMLQNNVAGRFGDVESETGGKTGTTNDYADGWFMGITPSLVVGTWVGGDDQWIRFLTLADGQGSVMARPIFQKFINKLEVDEDSGYKADLKFGNPPPEYFSLIDCEHFKRDEEDEIDDLKRKKKKKDEFEDEFGDDF